MQRFPAQHPAVRIKQFVWKIIAMIMLIGIESG